MYAGDFPLSFALFDTTMVEEKLLGVASNLGGSFCQHNMLCNVCPITFTKSLHPNKK